MQSNSWQLEREPSSSGYLGLVNCGCTVGLGDLVKRFGGDPDRVIEVAGLRNAFEASLLRAKRPEITLSAFSSILRAAAIETKRPTLSLEFGQEFDTRSLGAIGYLFDLAPDMVTALTDFCAAFELVQKNTEIGFETHGEWARIHYSVRDGAPAEMAPDAEFSVTMLGAALRRSLGEFHDVHRVDFEHVPTWQSEAAPSWLGRDFRPNSNCNAIYVRRSVLSRPGHANDPTLYAIVKDRVQSELKQVVSRNELVKSVSHLLTVALMDGNFAGASAANVAGQLGMSSRTLHKHLASYGTGFREIRNSVMLDRAKALLAEDRSSITEIALILGFSETSAFSRAFRDLTGLSPAEFRKI